MEAHTQTQTDDQDKTPERGDPAGTAETPMTPQADDRMAAAGTADHSDNEETARPGLAPEFAQLVHLSTKYPEIGPPVAELAFKVGYPDFGRQLMHIALERERPGLEYYSIAARYAKQAQKHDEALRYCTAAVREFVAAPERYPDKDDGARLLHLVRLGFTVLLFELKDTSGQPEYVAALAEALPKLVERLGNDPFYHTLLAQVLWYSDKEGSEREWDRAAELGEPEFTYNARGTWYKEAEHDADKAERAYRSGLDRAPASSLLLHNLAQLLLGKAARLKEEDTETARRSLQEADNLVRIALQGDCPKGLRRHIHHTRAEIIGLRASLRPRRGEGERRPPGSAEGEHSDRVEKFDEERLAQMQVGQVQRGKVNSLTAFGAFVTLEGGLTGLLHKSEMAHEFVDDPAQVLQVGQEVDVKIIDLQRKEHGRPRIGLSRKAVLPPPERAPRPRPDQIGQPGRTHRDAQPNPRSNRPNDREAVSAVVNDQRGRQGPNQPGQQGRPGGRRDQQGRHDRGHAPAQDDFPPVTNKIVSLGEMLLAKLKEQQSKS